MLRRCGRKNGAVSVIATGLEALSPAGSGTATTGNEALRKATRQSCQVNAVGKGDREYGNESDGAKRPMMISVDGNIGSGKSTLLSILKARYTPPPSCPSSSSSSSSRSVCFAPERTHEWKAMLPLYYEDTKRWSFPFQMQVLLSHIKNFKEAEGDLCFVERSPLAASLVFGELLKQEGLITSVEADLFDGFMEEVSWHPDVIIYLACAPQVCLERVVKRNRDGESGGGIPLEYLEKVSKAYEGFIQKYQDTIPVIKIDTNTGEVSDIFEEVQDRINKLLVV
ncbi:deoxynucleoside kinase [Chloropicon primus]|uniref:Deoxynucleoside kinase n=1 Tax=Chloropicon primus TaxID=1764295 RepID=A0A5B8MRJ7_9CHLO|nr:deoxynucleoside kinase [Chloropicon primus]UPR02570.1 deoxynucleoside kinase [Chloropicon primus]|eukprot:QDZ23358.1 deoxynucleoside kinase [Chloropicon primus]